MGLFDSNKTSTNNQTTNNDNRQVITTTSNSYDLSDRSADTTIVNNLDGGAIAGMVSIVGGALDGASKQTLAGYNFADSIFNAATEATNAASARVANAYDRAAMVTSDALLTVRDAYKDSTKTTVDALKAAQVMTADAYADAKGTTNSQKQIIFGVLAVAGLLALAAFQRKAA